MKKYTYENLKFLITENPGKIVLFGAGDLGSLAKYALKTLDINVDFFCDSDKRKQGKMCEGVKIISPEELLKTGKKFHIFISHNYLSEVYPLLTETNFSKIYNCVELLEKTNFNQDHYIDYYSYSIQPEKIKRRINFYKEMCKKDDYIKANILNLKSIDIQITERCSLKCKNCANLMQYYVRPVNSNFEELFESINKLMLAIDRLDEFRLLGGDPFMNKQIGEIIPKLCNYTKVKNVVVYTNATILPKGKNLECLKDPKVILDITNYGDPSRKHDEFVDLLIKNKIKYSTFRVTKWTDSGKILPYQTRPEEERKKMFVNCCNSDLLTVLHGKIFRCPFSANGENLKAFPANPKDSVNLLENNIDIEVLRKKIKDLVYNKKYLSACSYCNGRDYNTPEIIAAEQTKRPLHFEKII